MVGNVRLALAIGHGVPDLPVVEAWLPKRFLKRKQSYESLRCTFSVNQDPRIQACRNRSYCRGIVLGFKKPILIAKHELPRRSVAFLLTIQFIGIARRLVNIRDLYLNAAQVSTDQFPRLSGCFSGFLRPRIVLNTNARFKRN